MKDAVRLLIYFAAVILLGALLAPALFWGAQWLAGHPRFDFLAAFDFETFFHRALLIAALILIWPLFQSMRARRPGDLDLQRNPARWRDVAIGFPASFIPLIICGAILIAERVYSLRHHIAWNGVAGVVAASIFVPLIEESFFRGLILGVLLRTGRKYLAIVLTSALFAIVHFLKAPEHTSPEVSWISGFRSIANSFDQFSEPMLVLTAFTTLFLIGWILADARIQSRSLWLPIGLHAGWIFGNGIFNRLAHREMIALPWIGKNLLIGIIPLGVACLTWIIVRMTLRREYKSSSV